MSSEVSTNNKSISETQVEMLDKHTEEHEQHDFSLRIFHAIIHSKPQKSLMDSCPYSENLMSSLLHSLKSPLTQPLRPLPHDSANGQCQAHQGDLSLQKELSFISARQEILGQGRAYAPCTQASVTRCCCERD